MTASPDITEIAVVGAGPAGAWAAYQLAKRGARVAIFDPSHPREKPCGGGVTGRALALVDGAIDRSNLPAVRITRARFLGGPEGAAVVPMGDGALVVASRTDFDGAVLAAACRAGAVHVAARVTDVTAECGGVRIETSRGMWHARFVIGADGATSLVRRRFARPFGRSELSIATGYFAEGVASREIVIEMVADPPGYIWSFPRPGHLAIGICAQAGAGVTAVDLRGKVAAWIRETRIAPDAALRAYSWPIPSFAAPGGAGAVLAGERWCLVGDAAGLVDPITREGIFFALQSGAWAAQALAADGAPANYAARVQADIVPELVRAARLKAGFFRPAFGGLLLQALAQSAGVRAVMADLIAGQQSYIGLRRRLLRTLELGLAWKALAKIGRGTML